MATPIKKQADPTQPGKRTMFALAAALAATAMTGALAVAGLTRHVSPAPAVPQVGQTLTPSAQVTLARMEPGD